MGIHNAIYDTTEKTHPANMTVGSVLCFCFFMAVPCGTRDPSSPAAEAQSPKHCTTRESPIQFFMKLPSSDSLYQILSVRASAHISDLPSSHSHCSKQRI